MTRHAPGRDEPADAADYGALQTLWAELIVATLADVGVTRCVLSPGSRSTPLAVALASEPRIDTRVVIDERTAAFTALGLSRGDGGATALVCTSGTAAAHYLPALIEAHHDYLPLVAITADRPPELWQAGASQTIDQTKLYGDVVRTFCDLGAPTGTPLALRALRRRVAQAVSAAQGPVPGPVHIQAPFRKPLEPIRTAPLALGTQLRSAPVGARFHPRVVADDEAIRSFADALSRSSRPLFIVGPGRLHRIRPALAALAAHGGAAIAADAGSDLRRGECTGSTVWVDHLDLLSAADAIAAPDLLVFLGHAPVAAAWSHLARAWSEVPRWVLADYEPRDPDSSAAGIVVGDVAESLARVTKAFPAAARGRSWLAQWRHADGVAHQEVVAAVAGDRGEAAVIAAVWSTLSAYPQAGLVVGNSLPIRVLDWVAATSPSAPRVFTQRGAAGIDGLIAGAAGVAAHMPVVALVGDVSFAHDLGGLLVARACAHPVVVVVIDNGGGRIFDGLPVADVIHPDLLQRLFHTPPQLHPAALASALGAQSAIVNHPGEIAAAITRGLSSTGLTVIHAPVAQDGARQFRAHVTEAIRAVINRPPTSAPPRKESRL